MPAAAAKSATTPTVERTPRQASTTRARRAVRAGTGSRSPPPAARRSATVTSAKRARADCAASPCPAPFCCIIRRLLGIFSRFGRLNPVHLVCLDSLFNAAKLKALFETDRLNAEALFRLLSNCFAARRGQGEFNGDGGRPACRDGNRRSLRSWWCCLPCCISASAYSVAARLARARQIGPRPATAASRCLRPTVIDANRKFVLHALRQDRAPDHGRRTGRRRRRERRPKSARARRSAGQNPRI